MFRLPSNPIVWLLPLLALDGGCAGYQLGSYTLYRPDIKTVHVPVFQSDSLRRNLGERLTEAVAKEIELRTPYKVVQSTKADSVLVGRIVLDEKRALVENSFGDLRAVEIGMHVALTWTDRRGNLIGTESSIPISDVTLSINQTASFVPEAGQSMATAQQEAIGKLARQIVSQMESPW